MKKEHFVGVKTTKIYCLPTCPARAPLPENIVYFETPSQAEKKGYRPCKRCFPDFPVGMWIDKGASVLLPPPKEFDFRKCMKFLARSYKEPCHGIKQDILYKLLKFDHDFVLLKIRLQHKNALCIEFLTPRPKKSIRARAAKYVWEWFDLETDLRPFYRMAKKDAVLRPLVNKYYGLRILTIPDLFEAICWAIMGQHINVQFAYTLKKRFVESFGEKFRFNEKPFYLFPTPEVISQQTVIKLKKLQLTGKKSEAIIDVAKKMEIGALSRDFLLNKDDVKSAKEELMRLRGVGKWTADYVSLRCLKDPSAFPVDDVGLQNAIKEQLGLSKKPTGKEIYGFSSSWKNWEAYATFYLWNSLT